MNIILSSNNIPTHFENSKYIIHIHKEIQISRWSEKLIYEPDFQS